MYSNAAVHTVVRTGIQLSSCAVNKSSLNGQLWVGEENAERKRSKDGVEGSASTHLSKAKEVNKTLTMLSTVFSNHESAQRRPINRLSIECIRALFTLTHGQGAAINRQLRERERHTVSSVHTCIWITSAAHVSWLTSHRTVLHKLHSPKHAINYNCHKTRRRSAAKAIWSTSGHHSCPTMVMFDCQCTTSY